MKGLLFISLSLLLSCQGKLTNDNFNIQDQNVSFQISSEKNIAQAPYFTKNHKNEPVLVWTEGEGDEALICYRIYHDEEKKWNKPTYILQSKGVSANDESMAKIAFKDDGTVIAVFRIKEPTDVNKYASSIYYTISTDNGKNWTKKKSIHSNTEKDVGRGFVDISKLPDGEIGAVWLDGRKKYKNGSSLYFSKTNSNNDFVSDIEIAKSTCQCCRTEIHISENNEIIIAFRDITGNNIRDIASIHSFDSGRSFSKPITISYDNWKINGCPHTGPTVTSFNKKWDYFWFSAGGNNVGIYHTSTNDHGNSFSDRYLVDSLANHPQAIAMPNGAIALVYDETIRGKNGITDFIGLKIFKSDTLLVKSYLTNDYVVAHHPVISTLKNGQLIIAWTQKTEFGSRIYYSII